MRLVFADLRPLGGAPTIGSRPGRTGRGARRLAAPPAPADQDAPSRGRRDKRTRRPRRSRRWGAPIYVSDDIRVQARGDRRAALVPVRDGLWLLGDVDADALEQFTAGKNNGQEEFGALPILAMLLTSAASAALKPGGNGGASMTQGAIQQLDQLFRRRPRVDDEDDDVALGCAGRRCRCGGGR